MIAVEIAVLAMGLAIGVGLMVAARRTAQGREQSVRRQRTIQGCLMILVAAILIFDAIDTPHHRWFNIAVLALMAGGVSFDWLKRRRTMAR